MSLKATFFFVVKTTAKSFWNDAGMLLKSFWTNHLQMIQMMNGLEYSRIELVDKREDQKVKMKPTLGSLWPGDLFYNYFGSIGIFLES